MIPSRVIVILLIWVSSALGGGGRWVGGYLGWTTIVYMSSGVFRGKESSNRIKLSWLVQDLFNFGVLDSLWFWVGACGGGGVWGHLGHGGVPTNVHTHMHTQCTHMQTHMYTCIKIANGHRHGGIHVYHVYNMFNMHVHACVHVCMYMHVYVCMRHRPTHPSHPSTTPPGGTPRIGQNSITLELIKIFQFCLKI